jgi:hypothetical protein
MLEALGGQGGAKTVPYGGLEAHSVQQARTKPRPPVGMNYDVWIMKKNEYLEFTVPHSQFRTPYSNGMDGIPCHGAASRSEDGSPRTEKTIFHP